MSARAIGLCAAAMAVALAVTLAGCAERVSSRRARMWNDEIARLQATQDSLRARAAEIVAADPRLASIPKGDVVISVPTSFVRQVIVRVFDDVADHVTLTLKGLKAHIAKPLKKGITIGTYVLDVDIQEVVGTLKPGTPRIEFGGNRVAMTLPVDVDKGTGRAIIHFVWDGKNVAGVTCGDLDVTQPVDGNVVPSSYVVSGSLKMDLRGNRIVCVPAFPETKVRLRVEPSRASWAAVDSIINLRGGMCGWVLDRVDIPAVLQRLVNEKGFNVKLPVHKIQSFTLPAGVRDTVTVAGRSISLSTRTNSLRIDPDAIWYSADVAVRPK